MLGPIISSTTLTVQDNKKIKICFRYVLEDIVKSIIYLLEDIACHKICNRLEHLPNPRIVQFVNLPRFCDNFETKMFLKCHMLIKKTNLQIKLPDMVGWKPFYEKIPIEFQPSEVPMVLRYISVCDPAIEYQVDYMPFFKILQIALGIFVPLSFWLCHHLPIFNLLYIGPSLIAKLSFMLSPSLKAKLSFMFILSFS